MQRGMLAESLLAHGRAVNIEQIVCELEEPLDPTRFREAWQSAIDCFDALRLEFRWEKPDDPVVRVRIGKKVPFRFESWAAHSEAEQRAMLASFFDRDRAEGFDPFNAPLMRVSVFELSKRRWCFVWTVHHCIIDGGSYALVLQHVLSTYQGDPAPVGPAPSYLNFIRWSATKDTRAGVEHFERVLQGFFEPTEGPLRAEDRALSSDSQVVEHRRCLDVPTTEALRALAGECTASLNTITQLCWGILLSRYAGRDDVVFGTTWSGRVGTTEEAKQTVGLLITTVPVRVNLSANPSIKQALRSLRQQHLDSRPFQQTSLNQIKAASGVAPSQALFRTLTVFEPGRFTEALAGMDERWKKRKVWSRSHTNYPLCLYTFVEGDALVVQLERDSCLYSSAEADQILRHYANLLIEIAHNPDGRIHALRMLDEAVYERRTVLEAEREQGPPAVTALQHILDRAESQGDHPAIETMDGASITYAELASRVRSHAQALGEMGVSEGDLVALLLSRSNEAVIAMLAAHYLGAAFMVADPEYPDERIAFMLNDSKAPFVLTDAAKSGLPQTDARIIDVAQLSRVTSSRTFSPRPVAPDSLAYVIYTSGSTGTPKGVCLSHGALSHHAIATVDAFGLRPDDRVLQFAALSFDVSLEEIFPTLCAGATLVLRSQELAQTSRSFFSTVARKQLTVLNLPTAFWHTLTNSRLQATWPRCVRLLVVGGEQASIEAHRRFRAGPTDGIRWINAYGPTECTITSTFYDDQECDHVDAIPIGRPYPGFSHFLLDHHLRPVPSGAMGQLYIGGCTLALGYLGHEQLTAERFVPHPWRAGARLYATGDLVKQTSSGNYIYVDRLDQQVKVRGFRIELGEIEARLLACQGVNEAAVIVQRERGGDATLIGFVVGDSGLVDISAVRHYLTQTVPSHMIPKRILSLDKLPRTPAGKIDRKRLAVTARNDYPHADAPAPTRAQDSIERTLAQIWSEILRKPVADPSTNFFEAGGHSLLVVQLFNEVESRLDRACDAKEFFRDPTLEGLARLVRGGVQVERRDPMVQLAAGDARHRPIFLVPGVTGLELDYIHLAEALGSMVPVFGLRLPGLSDVEGQGDGLEAMAQTYAELICQVQPRGPYALAGYSAGGIGALAIAEELLKLGHEVDFLGVLDGTPPATVPIPSPFTSLKRFSRLARTTVARLQEIFEEHGSLGESVERVTNAALRALARWFRRDRAYHEDIRGIFGGLQVDFAAEDLASMQAQLDSMMEYRPKKILTNLILFRVALDPFEGPHEPDLGWGRVVSGAVHIEWLPGRHHELLTPVGVSRLASAMMRHLQQRAAHQRPSTPLKKPIAIALDPDAE